MAPRELLLALAAVASLASVAVAQFEEEERLITELHVHTWDREDASLTFGGVEVDIYTRQPTTVCEIMHLDSAENDFQAGDTNFFYGDMLEECDGHLVAANSSVDFVRLTLRVSGSWLPEWVRVVTDNNRFVECPNSNEVWLDNDGDFVELPCHA